MFWKSWFADYLRDRGRDPKKKWSVVGIQELSFEDALNELERIVMELESSKLSLDESLKLFERGIQLVRICNSRIEKAERQIESLTGMVPEDLFEE